MNYKNNFNKKSGFSLLELSIVLIIISALMVAVIKGSDLISQAKLSAARQITANSPILKIDGLVLWLEPTLPNSFLDSEIGGLISVWNDASGANPNTPAQALQGTLDNQPIYSSSAINGLPALKFDGSDDYIEASLSTAITSEQLEVFIVYKRIQIKAWSGTSALYKNGSNDYDNVSSIALRDSTAVDSLLTERNGANSATSPHPGNNVAFIYSTKFDGTNNTPYINGTAQSPVASAGNFGIDRVLVGARKNGSYNSFNGYVAEFIVFDRALSDQERQDVTQYLSDKYQIPIS